MTAPHDPNHGHTKFFTTDKMKLTTSVSEQNVYYTYLCLVDEIQPTIPSEYEQFDRKASSLDMQSTTVSQQEEPTIQVERTKALHELILESSKADTENDKGNNELDLTTTHPAAVSTEDPDSENEEYNFLSCDNPNILKLTKMKWLTEDHESSPENRSPSLSPTISCTSWCSKDSDGEGNGLDDKYLSTILRLDKEHNMFGLSSIAIIGSRPSKQKRTNKEDERAVFHQTAIVQVCCGKSNCRHISKTDLPASLKCNGCRSCCFDVSCSSCAPAPCAKSICKPEPSSCSTCPSPYACEKSCSKTGKIDRNNCYGLKIELKRKPKYEPPPNELTPRASCVLVKPVAARPCTHTPRCEPPGPGFPYLLPCYWPARPSAPCSHPSRCFHNPPCRAPRMRQKVPLPPQYRCPRVGPCENKAKNTKCTNEVCPGPQPCRPCGCCKPKCSRCCRRKKRYPCASPCYWSPCCKRRRKKRRRCQIDCYNPCYNPCYTPCYNPCYTPCYTSLPCVAPVPSCTRYCYKRYQPVLLDADTMVRLRLNSRCEYELDLPCTCGDCDICFSSPCC